MMRGVLAVLVVAGLTLGVAACSSGSGGDATSGGSASTSQAPEDLRASAAEVATGLRRIETIAKDLAGVAGTDKARAKELDGQIEPVWKTIEGTIKANDQDAYISFEDTFAILAKAAEDGDAAKASQGADAVAQAVAAYLAKYPG